MKPLLLVLLALCSFTANSFAQDDQFEIRYIVIAEESNDYDTLLTSAKDLAKITRLKYDDQDTRWSPKKGLYLREDSEDEIWAGGYSPRRYFEDLVTLEMKDAYLDRQPKKPSMTMIIVAGIFETKRAADARLKLIKQHRPLAYIRRARLYMGCIH